MTPNEVIRAYQAINRLSSLTLPYKKTRELSRLKRRITEEFDVVVDMERALAERHSGKSENGRYSFKNPETADAFFREYENALKQDADIRLPGVDLSAHVGQIRISVDDIEALDGIVIFEREEADG